MSPAFDLPLHILFLCTHNSARSILAEALLNHMGQGRFRGYSAGSSPRKDEQPHPLALQALRRAGISTVGLFSKSWEVFAQRDAPHMDLIITVCDSAAQEVCPVWPGHPATAHWGYADPSRAPGNDEDRLHAFLQTLHLLHQRLELLIHLPHAQLLPQTLQGSAHKLADG
ncbi:MAG: arsenate reductase ArsC [Limnohabitans sp.]